MGTTIDLSTITVSNKTPYIGKTWTRSSSVGTLNDSTYVIGNGNETLTVNAASLSLSTPLYITSNLPTDDSGNSIVVKSESGSSTLRVSGATFIGNPSDSSVTYYYTWFYRQTYRGEEETGEDFRIYRTDSGVTNIPNSNSITFENILEVYDMGFGIYEFFAEVYAVGEGGIRSAYELQTPRFNILYRTPYITINENNCGTLSFLSDDYNNKGFYVYDNDDSKYSSGVSKDTSSLIIPLFKANVGEIVNGFYTLASNGEKVLTVKGNGTSTSGGVLGITSPSVTGYTDGVSWKADGDKTLYAQCSKAKYEVAYDCNGGTGAMSNSTFTYGSTYTLPAEACSNGDYVFQGWATSSTGATVYKNGASVSNLSSTNGATVTLYAKWKLYNYKVTSSNGTYYEDTLKKAATIANVAGATVTLLKSGVTADTSATHSTFTKSANLVIGSGKTLNLGNYRIAVAEGATLTNTSAGTLKSNATPMYIFGAYHHGSTATTSVITTDGSYSLCNGTDYTCNTVVVAGNTSTATGGTLNIYGGSINNTGDKTTISIRAGSGKLSMTSGIIKGTTGGIAHNSSSSVVINGGTIYPTNTNGGYALGTSTVSTGNIYIYGSSSIANSYRGLQHSGSGTVYMHGGTINCNGATKSSCVLNGYDKGTAGHGNTTGVMHLYAGTIYSGFRGIYNQATGGASITLGKSDTSYGSILLVRATATSSADGLQCGEVDDSSSTAIEKSYSRCYLYNGTSITAKSNAVYNRYSYTYIAYGTKLYSSGTGAAVVYNASVSSLASGTVTGSTTTYYWGRVFFRQGMISGGSNGISSYAPTYNGLQIGSATVDLYSSSATTTKTGPLILAGSRGVYVGSSGTTAYEWGNGVLCGKDHYSYHDMTGHLGKVRGSCDVKTGTSKVSNYNCGWLASC